MRKSMELKSIWFAPPKLIFAVSIHHSLFLFFCKGFLSDRKVAEKFFEKRNGTLRRYVFQRYFIGFMQFG